MYFTLEDKSQLIGLIKPIIKVSFLKSTITHIPTSHYPLHSPLLFSPNAVRISHEIVLNASEPTEFLQGRVHQ